MRMTSWKLNLVVQAWNARRWLAGSIANIFRDFMKSWNYFSICFIWMCPKCTQQKWKALDWYQPHWRFPARVWSCVAGIVWLAGAWWLNNVKHTCSPWIICFLGPQKKTMQTDTLSWENKQTMLCCKLDDGWRIKLGDMWDTSLNC